MYELFPCKIPVMCPEHSKKKFPGKLRRILKKKDPEFFRETSGNPVHFPIKISRGENRKGSGHFPELADYWMLPTGLHGLPVGWYQAYSPPSVPTQRSLMLGMDGSGHFTGSDTSFRRSELHKFFGKRSE